MRFVVIFYVRCGCVIAAFFSVLLNLAQYPARVFFLFSDRFRKFIATALRQKSPLHSTLTARFCPEVRKAAMMQPLEKEKDHVQQANS